MSAAAGIGQSSGPYAINGGVRIRYRTAGRAGGEAVLLVHGFFGSLEGWYDYGYIDALGDAYRFVLVDARGHGDSEKPSDPALYSHEARAQDVVAVMDAEGIAAAHFVGYSMGGWIGEEAMPEARRDQAGDTALPVGDIGVSMGCVRARTCSPARAP